MDKRLPILKLQVAGFGALLDFSHHRRSANRAVLLVGKFVSSPSVTKLSKYRDDKQTIGGATWCLPSLEAQWWQRGTISTTKVTVQSVTGCLELDLSAFDNTLPHAQPDYGKRQRTCVGGGVSVGFLTCHRL